MNPQVRIKIITDVLMTFALLFLMGYQFWGDIAHEWVGAGMFILFIAHHILNKGWYRSLFKGKYTPARIFQLIVDILVFLAMVGLMVSGVILSNHVFAILNIRGGMAFARVLHMSASYWGFVLMAVHLGLHWGIFINMAGKAFKMTAPSKKRRILLNTAGAGIAVYGLFVFIHRNLLSYMLVLTEFVFLDFSEPVLRFYVDYLAMMGTFVFLAYYFSMFLRKINHQ